MGSAFSNLRNSQTLHVACFPLGLTQTRYRYAREDSTASPHLPREHSDISLRYFGRILSPSLGVGF
jgi:hypothetical protein